VSRPIRTPVPWTNFASSGKPCIVSIGGTPCLRTGIPTSRAGRPVALPDRPRNEQPIKDATPRRGNQNRGVGVASDPPGEHYLLILVTRPAPTVRPPSRMAKRRPSSIAMGWMRFTDMLVESPGMTISVPSGRVTTPVTSVVRK